MEPCYSRKPVPLSALDRDGNLDAAFVVGSVMTIGILGINLLFGNRETAGFIWITFSSVINAGVLLALPIALIVSVIVQGTRKSHREGVTL